MTTTAEPFETMAGPEDVETLVGLGEQEVKSKPAEWEAMAKQGTITAKSRTFTESVQQGTMGI